MNLSTPFHKKAKATLKTFKRIATKKVEGLKFLPYEYDLGRLKLASISYRRTREDIVTAKKRF